MQQRTLRLLRMAALWAAGLAALAPWPSLAQTAATADAGSAAGNGPIRLRQPQAPSADRRGQSSRDFAPALPAPIPDEPPNLQPGDERTILGPRGYRPGEFERYIQRLTNSFQTRRLGADLVLDTSNDPDALDFNPVVPADYVVAAGDEVVVSLWGAVDADLRLIVDRNGRIQLPRIGTVLVAGVKYQDLAATIDRYARRVFKNYELSVTLGQLRGIRVFVTGFADKPGAYSVSSLATVSSVLFKAGGPSASGSYRDIELRRQGKVLAKLDLYELIVSGRRDADQLVQAADVIHVGPVGKQVAVIGSVNKPAIVELKPGDTVENVVQMAGGFNSVADRSRVAIERLDERSDLRVRQLAWPADQTALLDVGDVVRVFSAITATLPLERQNKRVRIEGEVVRPGEYIMPPRSSMKDLIKVAGGFTSSAYLFGVDFSRDSVRTTQQTNYERALRDLELQMSSRSSTTLARTSEEVAAQASQQATNDRLLQRLREVRPTGRVVLQLPPDAKELPDLALEDGDRLFVPALPTTVGVFGSVFNAGSFLFLENRNVEDYLRLAGSPTRGADTQSVFVVRANGSVISAQQRQNWLGSNSLGTQPVQPGDTVYVPEEINKITFLQGAKDWTQVLYQFGVGLAAILNAAR